MNFSKVLFGTIVLMSPASAAFGQIPHFTAGQTLTAAEMNVLVDQINYDTSISGTVAQGTQGSIGSPWYVDPGTATFPITGNLTGTSTFVCASGCSGGTGGGGTVTQGPQGTNTSPWFVSPGTSTFPITGVLTGTSTVFLANGTVTAVPTGTQTVAGPVAQGVQGTNTSPWFVSPGTSTFPVSGTVTAVPTGTQTVAQSGALVGTSTIAGTVAVSTATVGGTVAVSTATVGGTVAVSSLSGTATTTEPNVNANAGSASTQDVNIQQIGAGNINQNHIACGTVATVLAAARATRQSIQIENLGTGTIYIGGTAVTTSIGLLLPPTLGASITIPTNIAIDCIATATSTVAFSENY